MKEEFEIKNLLPQFPVPTEKGVTEAADNFLRKFGKTLSKEDALAYAKLRVELGFWLDIEKEYEEKGIPKNIVKEFSGALEESKGQSTTVKQAYLEAEKSLLTAIMHEKIRINEELQTLIDKYKS